MLLAGMDVSGDENNTNYKFLGIVIGTNESIMSLSSSLGSFPEHMSRIDNADKPTVIQKLQFDSTNRIAYCVTLDRKRIVDSIMSARRVRDRRIGKGKVLRTYNYVVIQEIKKIINDFLISHNCSITDLVVQCDRDAKPFLKIGSIKDIRKGAAYRISDYVAWCNNRNRASETIVEIDFTESIPDRMKKMLKLN